MTSIINIFANQLRSKLKSVPTAAVATGAKITIDQFQTAVFPSSSAVSGKNNNNNNKFSRDKLSEFIIQNLDPLAFIFEVVANNPHINLSEFVIDQQQQSSSFLHQIILDSAVSVNEIASVIAKQNNNSNETLAKLIVATQKLVFSTSSPAPSTGSTNNNVIPLQFNLFAKVESKEIEQQLARFVKAQDKAQTPLSTAIEELSAGRKRSCWIWYIFPQFLDPGRSSAHNSEYQIHGQLEAVAYLAHPTLGQRQRDLFALVRKQLERKGIPICTLFGTEVDAKKAHHSASTFLLAAQSLMTENDARGGVIEKYLAVPPGCDESQENNNRWKVITDLADDLHFVIKAIQANPYKSIVPVGFTAANLPEHDPIMVAAWKKSPSWI